MTCINWFSAATQYEIPMPFYWGSDYWIEENTLGSREMEDGQVSYRRRWHSTGVNSLPRGVTAMRSMVGNSITDFTTSTRTCRRKDVSHTQLKPPSWDILLCIHLVCVSYNKSRSIDVPWHLWTIICLQIFNDFSLKMHYWTFRASCSNKYNEFGFRSFPKPVDNVQVLYLLFQHSE